MDSVFIVYRPFDVERDALSSPDRETVAIYVDQDLAERHVDADPSLRFEEEAISSSLPRDILDAEQRARKAR